MAKEPISSTENWDEARELVDGFRTLQQSYYPGYVMQNKVGRSID